MQVTATGRTALVPRDPAGRAVLARFFRALGDPGHLALLAFTADAGRTGTGCAQHPGLARSRVPAHLACGARRSPPRRALHPLRGTRPEGTRTGATGSDGRYNAAAVAACTRVNPPS